MVKHHTRSDRLGCANSWREILRRWYSSPYELYLVKFFNLLIYIIVLAGIPAMAAKTDASRDHHKSALNAILTSPITITTNLKGDSDVWVFQI